MTRFEIPVRRFTPVLPAVAVAALLAACGSSTPTTASVPASGGSTTASRSGLRLTSFRTCLKAHGVTLPRRPAGGGAPPGGGFFGGGGRPGAGGGFRNNPKLAAAFKACGGGNFRGGRRFRIPHTTIENYVKCVRQHGYPQMPNPNFSGKGAVFPSGIRSNQKLQTASRACASVLVPSRPGGTGTATTSSQT